MMIVDKPARPVDAARQAPRQAPQPDRRSSDDQTVDDELTEALKGTFPGSDPVALESPLVSRSRNSKRT